MDRQLAEAALEKLAPQFQLVWRRTRHRSFRGEILIDTENTTYRFVDGMFMARSTRRPHAFPVWECPPWMKGVELVGFLHRERGMWSLAPTWSEGSLAVITTSTRSLTLTSPTVSYDQHQPTLPTIRIMKAAPIRRSA